MLIHCLLYVPTISITNSIAFAQMKDAQKEFGIVRMGGTIGWILAAWPFTFILVDWDKVKAANPQGIVNWLGTVLGSGLTGEPLLDATTWTFIVAGNCLAGARGLQPTLPHTPAKKVQSGSGEIRVARSDQTSQASVRADPLVVTFVDSFVHNLLFNWTGLFLRRPDKGGGNSGQLGDAGHEHRATRRNYHDGFPWRGA